MNGRAADVLRWYVIERARRAFPGTLAIDDDGIARVTVKADGERWTEAALLCKGVPELVLKLMHVLVFGDRAHRYSCELPEDGATGFSAEFEQVGRVALVTPRARSMDLYSAARVIGITGQQARRLVADALLIVAGRLAEWKARERGKR